MAYFVKSLINDEEIKKVTLRNLKLISVFTC